VAVLAAALLPALAPAQAIRRDGPDRPIDAAGKKAAIDGVIAALEKNYVFPETAKKMGEDLHGRLARMEYDSVTSSREFAQLLTDHLRAVCKDKHLRVLYSPDPLPVGLSREPSPEVRAKMERMATLHNCGFKKVEQLNGGVGLLELEGFMTAEKIGDVAAAAMSFLANSDSVIVDLRGNGGGDPAAVILLCSYFFHKQTHLNDIYDRPAGTTRQFWSHPAVPGKKLAGKDLYVLTSGRTFSGAEEFAYNMQAQKRGTIVGETTGGGAHPTTGVRASDHFLVGVPFARSINPVTKTNWEGTGVKPDIAVPADQALKVAHRMALRKALAKSPDEHEARHLKQAIAELDRGLEKLDAQSPGAATDTKPKP
jgi:hypothetical protein